MQIRSKSGLSLDESSDKKAPLINATNQLIIENNHTDKENSYTENLVSNSPTSTTGVNKRNESSKDNSTPEHKTNKRPDNLTSDMAILKPKRIIFTSDETASEGNSSDDKKNVVLHTRKRSKNSSDNSKTSAGSPIGSTSKAKKLK